MVGRSRWKGMLVLHDGRSQAMCEWRLKSGKAAGFLRFFNATEAAS